MPSASFADHLRHYGPEHGVSQAPSLAEARAYCRRLARSHYENFTVVSPLLPRHLRPHVCAVYAYCRWADDLADEAGPAQDRLALLAWWEEQLEACYQGRTEHPVFVALAETIRTFSIPIDPLADLLVAFRQDQRQTRYETYNDLVGYCRYSANPVGRLVLYLGRCHNADAVRLSDSICTGLQMVNFWQDVARDWAAGRIYLPQQACRQYGYSEADFAARRATDAFRRMLAAHVERAEVLLLGGLPLATQVSPELRLPVELFARGGLAVLEAIRRNGYDVWTRRPTLSRWQKLQLVGRAWWRSQRQPQDRGENGNR